MPMSLTRSPLFVFACAVLSVVACSEKAKDRKALDVDASLAKDLKLASDTSLYAEAADIALGSEPDSMTYRSDDAAMRVPTMRVRRPRPSATPAAPPPEPAESVIPDAPPEVAVPARAPARTARARTIGDESCQSPATSEQRRCLLLHLAASDVSLDRSYQSLISDLRAEAGVPPGGAEPASVSRLRAAQRAWLVYRDTECRRRNRGREGPLWAPVRAQCLGEFSARRTEELDTARQAPD